MPAYSAIIRELSAERFGEILGASSRKAREVYFHRHNVKAPASAARIAKPGAKNELRAARLYEVLKTNDDDELAEEILRTYLLQKRPLLAAALDHLGIEHDNGLTSSDDVQKIEKLSAKEVRALAQALESKANKDDIVLYLKFMGAPEVEAALA